MRAGLVGVLGLAGCDLIFTLQAPPGIDGSELACSSSDSYVVLGASGYKIVETTVSWEAAATECGLDGSHLAVPDDRDELELLQEQLQMRGTPEGFWLGIGRDTTAAPRDATSFFEVTGDQASISLWHDDEPDNGDGTGGEVVVRFDANAGFIDVVPDSRLGFICECDGRPVTKTFDWQ
jgi:hypothetical protein